MICFPHQVIRCCRIFHLPLGVALCILQACLESLLSFIKSTPQHGVQMVHKLKNSRCLKDFISSVVSSAYKGINTVWKFFPVLLVVRGHLSVEPHVSNLISRHPWPRL